MVAKDEIDGNFPQPDTGGTCSGAALRLFEDKVKLVFAGDAFGLYFQAAETSDGRSALGDLAFLEIGYGEAGVTGVAAQPDSEFGAGECPGTGVFNEGMGANRRGGFSHLIALFRQEYPNGGHSSRTV